MARLCLLWSRFLLVSLLAGCAEDYVSSTAQNKSCQNGILDQTETDVDCGGLDCSPCAEGLVCEANRDCADTLLCTAKSCQPAHCSDKEKSGDETDKDCGGSCKACAELRACKKSSDCTSLHCVASKCAAATCDDGIKNQLESDTDCGDDANQCPRCEGGSVCDSPKDCESGICVSGSCASSTCTDGVKNGTEGDVDCGQDCPSLCADGQRCGEAEDCGSTVCGNSVCLVSSCGDEAKNGSETDVDCGGPCEPCSAGDGCVLDTDCASDFCDKGSCRTPTCDDEAQNQEESDADCGDPAGKCERCDTGARCQAPSSCLSGVCQQERCVAATCLDGVRNGSEGDADCGGPCTARCADGSDCTEMSDCQSGVCKSRVCQAPECTDEVKNGLETDVDCGSECSTLCEIGEGCGVDGDCAINSCTRGICADPSCGNSRQDGNETDVNCGGDCPACADSLGCQTPSDCISQVCFELVCQPPSCEDSQQNGLESDVDCGGDCAALCLDGSPCTRNDDCLSGVCDAKECAVPTCGDRVRNDVETDVDCGGSVCIDANKTCALGRHCLLDVDCQSEVCDAVTALCVPQSCSDTRKNQDETDVDCGGGCEPCEAEQRCVTEADCIDKICTAKRCVAGSCDDGIANGNEGDTDCGGNCPSRCQVGDGCQVGSDCTEGVCATRSPILCLAASCDDGVRNGDEIGIDCAGSCSARCPSGQPCVLASDCVDEDTCSDYGICEPPNCQDDVKGPGETGIDCGGEDCGSTCEVGEECLVDSDCVPVVSGKCNALSVCAAAACGDQAKNGTETDVDCGGDPQLCAARCGSEKACDGASDCQSGVCSNRLCAAPSCNDDVTNGGESDQDCGSVCEDTGQLCATGLTCEIDADCATGWCQEGSCAVRSCTDGIKNGAEGDTDCGALCIGSTTTPLCPAGGTCGSDQDCDTGWCSLASNLCVVPTCSDSATNQGETAEDCGGTVCAATTNCLATARSSSCHQCAGVGDGCATDLDCLSMTCTDGNCAPADNCIGELLSDSDGLLADGSRICASINSPAGNVGCLSYLRCFFVNDCAPTATCFSSPTGVCNVNTVGGGSEPANAAHDTYVAAGCTAPLSPIP